MITYTLALALCLAGWLLAVRDPFWAVVGMAVLLPFDFALELPPTVYTNEVYLLGVGLGFILRHFKQGSFWKDLGKVYWIFLPFMVAVALSALDAVDFWGVVKQCIRWGEFLLVMLVAGTCFRDHTRFNLLLRVIIGAGLLASLMGLTQHFTGLNLFSSSAGLDGMNQVKGVMRAHSTFGHANQFAGFLILLIPLALELFFEQQQPRGLVLMGVVVLILGLTLATTYSRGGWLSTFLAVGILLLYYIPKNILRSLLLFLVFIALLLVLPFYVSKLNSRLGSLTNVKEDTAVTGRVFYQKLGWRLIAQKPVFGHGGGNYLIAIQSSLKAYPGETPYLDKHIHNLYTQIGVETGLLGLAAFSFFIIMTFVRLLRNLKTIPTFADRAMLVALAASCLAFLFHNMFDVLVIYARGIHLALVIGIGFGYRRLVDRKPEPARSPA
ncbi:MAG: O-antigen ligase family protein [candidate division FCPU426 bacterium]